MEIRNMTSLKRFHFRRRIIISTLLFVLGSQLSVPGRAQSEESMGALRAELETLRAEYEKRIAVLEERLARLEAAQSAAAPYPQTVAPSADLADLRAAAREAAGTVTREIAPSVVPTVGKERNLNRLNPEISFTGILLGSSSSETREEFQAQEFELDLQAALDPFSRTRWTIAFGEEGVEIEEGYVIYSSLPGGLELMAGKFRQRFVPLNRQHLHALPQSDYPLAIQSYFGEEGLAQTGLSFNWLLPKPWATANEITLEITDAENEAAFAGEEFEDFAVLGRLKNFWDLSPSTYIEWGLSGIVGETTEEGDSRVWGTDFTYHWQPPGKAKYREITWRTAFLLSQRDDRLGERQEAWGGYTYLEGLLRRNLSGGIRFDRAEDPLDPESQRWGLVPYLTWWQSEYVRLRGGYGFLKDDSTGESEDRFTLQLTWAAGPHKHETY
jgi:hypothetical protein